MMAKKRIKGYEAVRVNETLALGGLNDRTVVAAGLFNAPEDGHSRWNYSFEGFISIEGQTAGEGPIVIGCCHGDYNVTEIKEALEATDTNYEDQILLEQARRKVRTWGIFAGRSSEEWLNNHNGSRKYKIKFSTAEGNSVSVFAYNESGAALTAGAFVHLYGRIHRRRY